MWYVDVIRNGQYVDSVECHSRAEAIDVVVDFRKSYSDEDGYTISVSYEDD